MGRAERRRAERRDRIETKKHGTTMTYAELKEMKQDAVNKIVEFDVISLMTCFALTLHRLYGFGYTRISRSLQYIDELMGQINCDEAVMNDFLKDLENETGIIIKCGEK